MNQQQRRRQSRAVTLLGCGLKFPVQAVTNLSTTNQEVSSVKSLSMVHGRELVRQSIIIILETEPGERIMRPTFGCGLRRYLMKPNTTATRTLIQRDVESALRAWEPRIQLQKVSVDPGDDPAMVHITIAYTHVTDQSPDLLVHPFYLE